MEDSSHAGQQAQPVHTTPQQDVAPVQNGSQPDAQSSSSGSSLKTAPSSKFVHHEQEFSDGKADVRVVPASRESSAFVGGFVFDFSELERRNSSLLRRDSQPGTPVSARLQYLANLLPNVPPRFAVKKTVDSRPSSFLMPGSSFVGRRSSSHLSPDAPRGPVLSPSGRLSVVSFNNNSPPPSPSFTSSPRSPSIYSSPTHSYDPYNIQPPGNSPRSEHTDFYTRESSMRWQQNSPTSNAVFTGDEAMDYYFPTDTASQRTPSTYGWSYPAQSVHPKQASERSSESILGMPRASSITSPRQSSYFLGQASYMFPSPGSYPSQDQSFRQQSFRQQSFREQSFFSYKGSTNISPEPTQRDNRPYNIMPAGSHHTPVPPRTSPPTSYHRSSSSIRVHAALPGRQPSTVSWMPQVHGPSGNGDPAWQSFSQRTAFEINRGSAGYGSKEYGGGMDGFAGGLGEEYHYGAGSSDGSGFEGRATSIAMSGGYNVQVAMSQLGGAGHSTSSSKPHLHPTQIAPSMTARTRPVTALPTSSIPQLPAITKRPTSAPALRASKHTVPAAPTKLPSLARPLPSIGRISPGTATAPAGIYSGILQASGTSNDQGFHSAGYSHKLARYLGQAGGGGRGGLLGDQLGLHSAPLSGLQLGGGSGGTDIRGGHGLGSFSSRAPAGGVNDAASLGAGPCREQLGVRNLRYQVLQKAMRHAVKT